MTLQTVNILGWIILILGLAGITFTFFYERKLYVPDVDTFLKDTRGEFKKIERSLRKREFAALIGLFALFFMIIGTFILAAPIEWQEFLNQLMS